jgi:thermitase
MIENEIDRVGTDPPKEDREMSAKCFLQSVVAIAVASFCAVVWAGTYNLTVGGDRLEFVPQPERGYVVKLAPDTGGIHTLAEISALDTEGAREIRGLDRRGVWTVENNGPAGRNEEALRSLRAGGRVAYAAPLFSSGGETVAIIPEIVVRVKPGVAMGEIQRLCESAGCTIRKRMEFTQQEYLLEVLGPDAEAVFGAVEQLGRASEVEWACPNTACRPKLSGPSSATAPASSGQLRIASAGKDVNTPGVFPNDQYFPMQWHLYNTGQSGGTPGADIRAPEAWEITTGDPNVIVAVLDYGVDDSHPDLMNNLLPGYDFYDDDETTEPAMDHKINAHGTACAGLIAAQGNNELGGTGVTWNCNVMPIRIGGFRANGSEYRVTADVLATALRWAAVQGVDIFSSSPGWQSSPVLHSAVVDVTRTGGIGREGKGALMFLTVDNAGGLIESAWAETYPEVIAVGATDHKDQRCYYSNYGPELDLVAPSAPGYTTADWAKTGGHGWLWTTDVAGKGGYDPYPQMLDYTTFGGTSGACPIAAGAAALILSIEPDLTGDEVRHFLCRSAKDLGGPGRDDYYGWGRVDARAALDMVLAKRCDLNNDWVVDEKDLAVLLKAMETNDLSADIAPAKKRDGKVDQQDLELLTRYLGTVIPEPGIAHWKLDEVEGTTAEDSIHHCDGTLHGGAIWQPTGGQAGGAVQLDGVDDYVSTGFVLNPSAGPFSVYAWVWGGAPGQVILSQQGAASWLLLDPVGGLMTGLNPGWGSGPLISSAVITDGQWHQVGLVWDGSNRILYVDGVEVARDGKALPQLGSATGSLYFGADGTLAPGSFWSGLLDDVCIYDRVVKP